MVTERKIVRDIVNRHLLKEYVKGVVERAGFGGIEIQRNPMGTLVTLVAERPGMVIGHRGKTIKELTATMESRFHFDNPQIEVEEEKNPNLNATIMAHKLAVALERGWHFRRAGHSTVRKIMGANARGCQVVLAGKITGERHRTEKFREGHIKYCGESALKTMEIGYAVAKKKLGTIGIKVMIMRPGARLPDEVTIKTPEEAKGLIPEAVIEELKIDTTIQEDTEPDTDREDEAARIVEALIERSEREAAAEKARGAEKEAKTKIKKVAKKPPAKKVPKADPAMADGDLVADDLVDNEAEDPVVDPAKDAGDTSETAPIGMEEPEETRPETGVSTPADGDAEPAPEPASDVDLSPEPSADAEPAPEPASDVDLSPEPSADAEPAPESASDVDLSPEPSADAEPAPESASDVGLSPEPSADAEPSDEGEPVHTHDEVKKAKPRKTVKKATTRKAGEKNGTGSDVTKEKADPDASSDDGKEPSARKTKKPIPSTPPADTENDAGGAEASSDLEASGDSQ